MTRDAVRRGDEGQGGIGRVLFAAVWVAGQVALVLTADRRVDGAFGFRMFSESSTVKISLSRELIDGTRLPVESGIWGARGSDGKTHRVSWYERIPSPRWVFDREMHASHGSATQLTRLQRAADDVVAHLGPSDDVETRRLVLDVTVRRNGREAYVRELVSKERTF